MKHLLPFALLAGSLSADAGGKGGLGFRYTDHPEGLVITRVYTDSGSEAAGLAPGDRVVSVDGVPADGPQELPSMRGKPGTTVELGVIRSLTSESVSISVERRAAKSRGGDRAIGKARSAQDNVIHPAVARFAGAMLQDRGAKVKAAVRGLNDAEYGDQDPAKAIGRKLVRAAKKRKCVAKTALKEFSKVPDLPPGALYRMGEAYFILDKQADAKVWLKRALDTYPDDTARQLGALGRAEEMLANALWETGERQAAIDLTRRIANYRRVRPLTQKVGMADPTPEQEWEIALPPTADFTVETQSGGEWQLSGQKGKPVVLVFWATWCGPCKKEMPALARLLKSRPDWPVSFLAVSVDDDRAAAKAEKMVKEWDLPFPSTRKPALMKRFGVGSLPSLRVIGPRGSLRAASRGYSERSLKKLEATVDELVAEASGEDVSAAKFPFGRAWSAGKLEVRAIAGIDGVGRIAASPEGVVTVIADHGALALGVDGGAVTSDLEVEESLKSKQDKGVAWFHGPVSYGSWWIRSRSAAGELQWFVTMPSRIKAMATSGDQLWVALEDEMVVLDPSGEVIHRVPQVATAIAAATDGGVWAVDGQERVRVGPTGEILLRDDAVGGTHIVGDGRWATDAVKQLIAGAFGPEGATRTVGVNGMGLIVGLDGEGNAALRIHVEDSEDGSGPSLAAADLDGDGQDELLISSWDRGVATVEVEIP